MELIPGPLIIDPKYQSVTTFVPKGWGFEKWFVNHKDYCGKLLYFVAGKKCSWHYHKIKHETFYIHKGQVTVLYGEDDNIAKSSAITLTAGRTFTIPPGLRHQIYASTDTELFEFSTHHEDSDSYRVIKGD